MREIETNLGGEAYVGTTQSQGDRDKALRLLREAVGMPNDVEMAEPPNLLSPATASLPNARPSC